MTSTDRRPLLGRMAGLGWFSVNGEPAATHAMSMLFEEAVLREAVTQHVGNSLSVDLSAIRWFEAERVQDDLARPDLEGIDQKGNPLLVIEAKFGAALTAAQVRSYLHHQERRVDAGVDRAFLLLVPETRTGEAQRVLRDAHEERRSRGEPDRKASSMVVTWDEWFDTLDHAVEHLPASPDSLSADLVQLRGLCTALGGLVISPLAHAALGGDWRQRQEDLRTLVDQVTSRLRNPKGKMPPIIHETGFDPLRYLPGGYVKRGSALAVGLASRFADQGMSPLWVRWHKRTRHYSAIRVRIMASAYRDQVRTDDGHLWLPLMLQPEMTGPELVDDLVYQVETMKSVLASSDWSSNG